MGKVRVGTLKKTILVEGDINLLNKNEILISEEEGYTLLKKRLENSKIETYVVVPLKDFKDENNSRQKVEEG